MTISFSADAAYAARLGACIPDTILAPSWDAFCRSSHEAECAIVLIPWLGRTPTFDQLRLHMSRFPHLPIVLITHDDADNVRLIRGIGLQEVLWIYEIELRLPSAVQGVARSRFLWRIAAALEGADHLPAAIRAGLAAALRGDMPIRSVAELAVYCGRDRRTLWYHWSQLPAAEHLPLKDLLCWLLLLKAAASKVPGRKWSAVAKDLGTDTRTLARWARGLAGLRLQELATAGIPVLLPRFDSRVLSHLLPADALDNLA